MNIQCNRRVHMNKAITYLSISVIWPYKHQFIHMSHSSFSGTVYSSGMCLGFNVLPHMLNEFIVLRANSSEFVEIVSFNTLIIPEKHHL